MQFAPRYKARVPWYQKDGRKGPRPVFTPADALGLVLTWLVQRGQEKGIVLVFGETPSVVNTARNRALLALLETLERWPPGKITWPTAAQVRCQSWGGRSTCACTRTFTHRDVLTYRPARVQIAEHAALVQGRERHLAGCFAAIDGLNLQIQEPGDPLVQNANYNGYVIRVNPWGRPLADGLGAPFSAPAARKCNLSPI